MATPWTCASNHTCVQRSPVGDEHHYATQEMCEKNCHGKLSGVIWVYITVGALLVLGLLLFFVMRRKGDAGMKGLAATQILEGMGSVLSAGTAHVQSALNLPS